MKLDRILETVLYAHDLVAAESFYTKVLGLEVESRMAGRHVFFKCGDAMFLVFNPDKTEIPNPKNLPPVHGSRGAGHVAWVIAYEEVDAWRRRLQEAGVAIESENRLGEREHQIYFRDPAGNLLELATPNIGLY